MRIFITILIVVVATYLFYRFSTKDEREASEARDKMFYNSVGYAVTKKIIERQSDVHDSIMKKFVYLKLSNPDSVNKFIIHVDSLVREGKKISISDF